MKVKKIASLLVFFSLPLFGNDYSCGIDSRHDCFNIENGVLYSYNCNANQVTIPDSVHTIAGGVFSGEGITSVLLPDGLIDIGHFSFQNNNIKTITIPNSVFILGTMSFDESVAIKSKKGNFKIGNALKYYPLSFDHLQSSYSDELKSYIARIDDVGGCGEKGIPENSATGEITSLVNGIEKAELKKLVYNICNQIGFAQSNNVATIAKDVELMVLKYNGWDRSTPDYKKKFTKFLNDNSKDFICTNQGHRYKPEHIFKRVISMKYYTPILTEFLLSAAEDDEDENMYDINVNVITKDSATGKPETVLDYLDRVLADPGVKNNYDVLEIERLRVLLVRGYGAKHAKDLLELSHLKSKVGHIDWVA